MKLVGKRALITGAASGIGFHTAEMFVAEGATVTLVDRNEELVRRAAAGLPGSQHALIADVANEAAVSAMVADAVAAMGGVDVLVTCAGLSPARSDFPSITLEDWRRVMEVNVTGTFLCCREVAKVMRPNSGASIVTVASVAGERVNRGTSIYGTSKAAVTRLTRSIAVDLAPLGIRANVICPGPVETPILLNLSASNRRRFLSQVPLGRAGQPLEIAAAAVFLASDAASFITAEDLHVDGGLTSAGWSFEDHTQT